MNANYTFHPPVHILIVDDSAFMRQALYRMISSEHDFEVVDTAHDGESALKKISALDPDVVTLDVEMPGLNGLDTLRRIMTQFPRPVIMVSAATEKDAEITLDALSAGAFDCVPKQLSPNSLDIIHIRSDLVAKIRAGALKRRGLAPDPPLRKPPASASTEDLTAFYRPAVVAIGASTGGPRALQEILPSFPGDFPAPILIVQHMPPGFTAPFAQRLNNLCAIEVREAVQHEALQPGVAYIAPAGQHMRAVPAFSKSHPTLALDTQPDNLMHIPSVDVLMKSVAEVFGSTALGVILTGMGNDGAEGMTAIHRQGGLTIGQDEASSAVYGMPRACAELGILSCVVPLSKIPAQILKATRLRRRA
jgi:two-component system, chemotaxis family, protein-glutamate methylesterase/glutaminase